MMWLLWFWQYQAEQWKAERKQERSIQKHLGGADNRIYFAKWLDLTLQQKILAAEEHVDEEEEAVGQNQQEVERQIQMREQMGGRIARWQQKMEVLEVTESARACSDVLDFWRGRLGWANLAVPVS